MTVRLLFLLLGAGVGAGAASALWWLSGAQAMTILPEHGRLPFIAVQIPALWYAYATACAFGYSILLWTVATLVGRHREAKHGPARRRSATWASLVASRAENAELRAMLQRYTDDMQRLLAVDRERKRQLVAIDAVIKSSVVDEVGERRMLEGQR